MSFQFQLIRIGDLRETISVDAAEVLKPGAMVERRGLKEARLHLVTYDPTEKIVVLKRDGASEYVGGLTGTVYAPSAFIIQRYRLNGHQVWTDAGSMFELPVKWKPGDANNEHG